MSLGAPACLHAPEPWAQFHPMSGGARSQPLGERRWLVVAFLSTEQANANGTGKAHPVLCPAARRLYLAAAAEAASTGMTGKFSVER